MIRKLDSLIKSRWFACVLIALCVGVVAVRALGVGYAKVDSWAPMLEALRFLQDGDPSLLYETVFFEKGIKFQYPPASLLFTEAVAGLGVTDPLILNGWNLAAMILNAVAFSLLCGRIASPILHREMLPAIRYVAFLVAMVYRPISMAYVIGNLQVLIDLFFTVACLLLLSNKDRLAGFAVGLAAAFKPQFAVILAPFALTRNWRLIHGLLGISIVLGLVSLWRYGWAIHVSYLDVLTFLSDRGESYHLNASLNGIANRWLENGSSLTDLPREGVMQSVIPPHHPAVAMITAISGMLFLAAPCVIALWRRDCDPLLLVCFAATCATAGSPVAWTHHYGILLPVYAIAARSILDLPRLRIPIAGVLFISFLATANRLGAPVAPVGGPGVLLEPATLVFAGALLLVAVLAVGIAANVRLCRRKDQGGTTVSH